jgi:hypothetical protein
MLLRSTPRGGWMNSQLRIARAGRVIAHFQVSRAFIDLWDFTDKDTCVVIRCVNAHGPSWIQKHRIDTGELVAEGSCSDNIPDRRNLMRMQQVRIQAMQPTAGRCTEKLKDEL